MALPHISKTGLAPPGIAHGFLYEVLRVSDVRQRGVAPCGGGSVGFGFREVAFGGGEQLHRLAETAFPAEGAVDGRMVFGIFSIVDRGAFGFADGSVNFLDGGLLIAHHGAPVLPIQERTGKTQIGNGA